MDRAKTYLFYHNIILLKVCRKLVLLSAGVCSMQVHVLDQVNCWCVCIPNGAIIILWCMFHVPVDVFIVEYMYLWVLFTDDNERL
jgi:hypothetical protein